MQQRVELMGFVIIRLINIDWIFQHVAADGFFQRGSGGIGPATCFRH